MSPPDDALHPETADLVCGRFTSSQRREALGERFEVAVPETYQHASTSPRSNGR